ncbi:MAG: phosphoglucosamine mutase [Nitrosopumilus sp. B06]|nr:MAG: phosphoglucosamine mutase [Nitrosopumilus sp. B06]
MGKYFGTNGIRGVFGEDFTIRFAHEMALSIGTHFGRGPILVGYDGRESSPAVCKAVTSALSSLGLDCMVAGLVPTPCLEFAVKKLGYAGGIMITASHNPPQYSGIKPASSDGVEISREDEIKVEDIYDSKSWVIPGKWGIIKEEKRAITTYIDGVLSVIDSESIRAKKFKLVLDIGNGAQTVAAPDFCKMLGCDIILIHSEIDADFSGRGPEPTPQNLSELSRVVVENGADLGVAFDGDGDRSIFCDESGIILTGDKSALVLARHILHDNPGSLVVTCINSGSAIEKIAAESGSRVVRTRVGSVEVSRRMVPDGALVGFEENGGFMYGRHNQVRDGCMTLGLMLELLASNKLLSKVVSALPISYTTKDKVPCTPEAIPALLESLASQYPGSDTSDGIKITTGPGEWVMVRPSGTEPIVRVYAEAQTQKALDSKISEFVKKTRNLASL